MVAFPKEYIESIPEIYKEILGSFPKIQPHRNFGDSLAVHTIQVKLQEMGKPHSLAEIKTACNRMADQGVVSISVGMFVEPSDIGERLIEDLTGSPARQPEVPEFPSPPVFVNGK